MNLLARDLSVIIPVGHGERTHLNLLNDLVGIATDLEIMIAAAFKEDKKDKVPLEVRWIECEQGRAKQLNKAARSSVKSALLFLHADSRLNKSSFDKLLKVYDLNALNYFDLQFDGANPLLRLNECGVRIRSRLLSIPFGDQGFCISKKLFEKLGRFNEKAQFGEDHLLVWQARKNNVPIRPIKAPLVTSSRKYEKNGWGKTTLSHVYLTVRQALDVYQGKFLK